MFEWQRGGERPAAKKRGGEGARAGAGRAAGRAHTHMHQSTKTKHTPSEGLRSSTPPKKKERLLHIREQASPKKNRRKREEGGRQQKKKRLRSLHTTKHNSTHTNINNRLIRIEDHIEERGTEEKEKKKRLSVGHSLSDGGCVMCIWLWGEERSDSVKECGMVGNEATMSEGLILLEIFLSGFEILRVFFCVFLVD